jgi:hypothetical protein
MKELTIKRIEPYYENYNVLIGHKWYFMSQNTLNQIIRGTTIKGELVKKRTRIWVEL